MKTMQSVTKAIWKCQNWATSSDAVSLTWQIDASTSNCCSIVQQLADHCWHTRWNSTYKQASKHLQTVVKVPQDTREHHSPASYLWKKGGPHLKFLCEKVGIKDRASVVYDTRYKSVGGLKLSIGDVSNKPSGRLTLLSAWPAITFPAKI